VVWKTGGVEDKIMEKYEIKTLGEVLFNVDTMPFDITMYMDKISVWNLSSICILSEEEAIDELPAFAKNNNVEDVFQLNTLKEISANLKEQVRNPSIEQLLDAFLFYYKNDAFIVLE
jgi:hypothetical protein